MYCLYNGCFSISLEYRKERYCCAGKLGSEPEILIQMYKQLIEQDTDLHVQLKPGLGKHHLYSKH